MYKKKNTMTKREAIKKIVDQIAENIKSQIK